MSEKSITENFPDLEETYTEEFGQIKIEVYKMGKELWHEKAAFYGVNILADISLCRDLMCRSMAAVSEVIEKETSKIKNLKGYLFQTFKHFILAELEKETRHRELELKLALNYSQSEEEKLENWISLNEVMKRMDSQTRRVFFLKAAGYKYEDMVSEMGKPANQIRSDYSKAMKRIKKEITKE